MNMIEEPQTETDSDRERLNRIAEQHDGDTLPEHTSWAEITDICNRLHEQVGDIVARHVEETSLTKREAQVWVLARYPNSDRVTLLDEAIALVLTAPETPFTVSDSEESDGEGEADVTTTDVKECFERAMEKYEAAESFVGLTTFRNRDEYLEKPRVEWLDEDTVLKLKDRARETDETLDDVINRLLDETVLEVSLDEVIETVVEEYEDIACIVVNHPELGDLNIGIQVFTPDADSDYEAADLYSPKDQVCIERGDDPVRRNFGIFATCDGPETRNTTFRTTIYMADNVVGASSLELDTGLTYLKEKLKHPDQWENNAAVPPLAQIRDEIET
jgi:hypothetical protein